MVNTRVFGELLSDLEDLQGFPGCVLNAILSASSFLLFFHLSCSCERNPLGKSRLLLLHWYCHKLRVLMIEGTSKLNVHAQGFTLYVRFVSVKQRLFAKKKEPTLAILLLSLHYTPIEFPPQSSLIYSSSIILKTFFTPTHSSLLFLTTHTHTAFLIPKLLCFSHTHAPFISFHRFGPFFTLISSILLPASTLPGT